MKGIFAIPAKQDKHQLSGKPVELNETLDGNQFLVTTPAGKKALVAVKHLQSFAGDLTFDANGKASYTEDTTAPELPLAGSEETE